ncbi:5-oxoprolinase subunit PxpA [Aquiflexum sp. LQ15W]|uniref:5-oxoprolinase subunit PxpA n=1 Tax=Cognataquiflexum nitidum TaxID=2922272 RepID=UPI001F12A680|nr:5-oxoprolinase subunit PxpA [Cognataquiflexum nitidum]MCH6198397.1 5-oxoprolinase subunit PxpA [Cognataquiflexum nitidum]
MKSRPFPLDINCDLGEGLPNDGLLMPMLDSTSIACGGHTGDEKSIVDALQLAKKFGVKVGAHPSYPDRENFGRKHMNIDHKLLRTIIFKQIQFFEKLCQRQGLAMHHVKPHGALYNFAAINDLTAYVLIYLMEEYFPDAFLYCPAESLMAAMAIESGIKIKREVFADRSYNDDLTLVDRSKPKALLTDPQEVIEHIGWMVNEKKIKTITGNFIPIEAETICIHGDNPAALKILNGIRANFGQ